LLQPPAVCAEAGRLPIVNESATAAAQARYFFMFPP
jgi:hypothetical protein